MGLTISQDSRLIDRWELAKCKHFTQAAICIPSSLASPILYTLHPHWSFVHCCFCCFLLFLLVVERVKTKRARECLTAFDWGSPFSMQRRKDRNVATDKTGIYCTVRLESSTDVSNYAVWTNHTKRKKKEGRTLSHLSRGHLPKEKKRPFIGLGWIVDMTWKDISLMFRL